MRLVIGCPIAERAWAIPDWYDALVKASTDIDNVSFVCVYTPSSDDTKQLLVDRDVVILSGSSITRPRSRLDNHRWEQPEYKYMAYLRNQLIDHCVRVRADYFLSIDSDIVWPDRPITELIETMDRCRFSAASPLVNMMRPPDEAWNYMFWQGGQGYAKREHRFAHDKPFAVDVIMAAMLIDHVNFHRVRWMSHPQGEDIGWSVNAYAEKQHLGVDPTFVCEHRMTPR